jgi:hypothetical protein
MSHDSDRVTTDLVNTREALAQYLQASITFMYECLMQPDPESDLVVARQHPVLGLAYTLAYSYLLAGIDYLRTLTVALHGDPSPHYIPQQACFALLRGCLEPAARASWLLEKDIAPRTRIARGLVERFYDSEQAFSMNRDEQRLRNDKNLLRSVAHEYSLDLIERKGKLVTVDGEARPGATAITGKILAIASGQTREQSFLFRMLSGFAHSIPYALLSHVSDVRELGVQTVGTADPPIQYIIVSAVWTVRVHQLGVERLGEYAGRIGAPGLDLDPGLLVRNTTALDT